MFIVWGLELCCVVDIVDKVDVYCLLFGVWGFCWVVDMLTRLMFIVYCLEFGVFVGLLIC